MPSKSLAPTVVRGLPPVVLGDAHKQGYTFVNDRWEGEEHYHIASDVVRYLHQQGWEAKIFEGQIDKWSNSKKVVEPYFKVYLINPEDKSLYSWWAPSAAEWTDPIKPEELTWFELVQPKSETKK